MVFQNGDFRFFWPESIKDFVTIPSAWDSSLNTGLGQPQLSTLWVTSYFNLTTFFTKLGLDWNLIQIIFWVLPAFFISFLSSFSLFGYLFKDKQSLRHKYLRKYSFICGLIYSLNTYFLMVLTGGQLGVSLSYSLIPLVFLRFIKLLNDFSLKNSILAGLALSFQLLFDPRIVYVTIFSLFVYFLFNSSKFMNIKNKPLLFVPFAIPILLNFYWILPLVLIKTSPLPAGFDSLEGFKFFSFANFSNGLSLLHPNWPENIFGKLYFLDPKFLVLPILAFSSLLFVRTMKQSNNRTIVFFCILAFLGVFLAKGANPPFGEINTWLFQNFPGMSMFRDPSKFYVLVALSYSILISFSLIQLSKFVKKNILFFTFILYFLVLVSPILGQIRFRDVPNDYLKLKNLLVAEETFSRTLWIPKWQRYGFFSNNHPAIGREELFKGDFKKQIEQLRKSERLIKDLSIKYIIVPYDSGEEIFLSDRRYDEKQYRNTVETLSKISWLKRRVEGFGKITVFELEDYKDHFFIESGVRSLFVTEAGQKPGISYRVVNPTEYKVSLKNVQKGNLLVFSERYDPYWNAKIGGSLISSGRFGKLLNSFVLPKDGDYEVGVYYEPQQWVCIGLIISGATLIAALGFLFLERNKRG